MYSHGSLHSVPARLSSDLLFGGSGLLAHVVKQVRPDATVIYNDFDNFSERLGNVDITNSILAELR